MPHVVPRGRRVVVSYERCEPPPDCLDIFRAQRVIGVGDSPVVRTDGQIKITACFVEQKRHPDGDEARRSPWVHGNNGISVQPEKLSSIDGEF